MSSILKALKKLEEEKTLRQEAVATNIPREIVRQQPEKSRLVRWLGATCLVATAVIVALSFLLIRKPADKDVARLVQPTAAGDKVAVQTRQATILPGKTPLQPRGTSLPPRPTPSPAMAAKADPIPVATRAGKANRTTPTPGTEPPAEDVPRSAQPVKQQLPQPPEASEHQPITLSGIAWNKDSADRLAIINGQQAATGTTISGVVVEEIMPDRVKVNSAGRTYEIFLGKPVKTN